MKQIILPESWDNWIIQELIGEGSFGCVYRAISAQDPEEVRAIKIIQIPHDETAQSQLKRDYPDEASLRLYFDEVAKEMQSEISLVQVLGNCKNVVSVKDYYLQKKEDHAGWTIYIMMDCLQSLPDYQIDHQMTEEMVVKLGIDVCSALERCADHGILHRDIKPDNVMVGSDGDFMLADFGIARQLDKSVGTLSLKGTYTYMAPEVYHGEKYGNKCDQYSLGIMLYRLMNNNRDPYVDAKAQLVSFRNREEALAKRMDPAGGDLPVPANASPGLGEIILKACTYDPSKRFKNATEMKAALLHLSGKKADVNLFKRRVWLLARDAKRQIFLRRKVIGISALTLTTAITGLVTYRAGIWRLPQKDIYNISKCDIYGNDTWDEEETVLSLCREYDDALWSTLVCDDIEEFTGIIGEENARACYENLKSMIPSGAALEKLEQRNYSVLFHTDDECYVEALHYRPYLEYPSKNVDQYSIDYILKKVDNEWQMDCINSSFADLSDELAASLLDELPETFGSAYKEDNYVLLKNAMWLETDFLYDDLSVMEAGIAWQNNDGTISMILSAKNGTDKDQVFTIHYIELKDGNLGSELLYKAGDYDVCVHANTTENYLVRIEPFDAEIDMQKKWNSYIQYEIGYDNGV